MHQAVAQGQLAEATMVIKEELVPKPLGSLPAPPVALENPYDGARRARRGSWVAIRQPISLYWVRVVSPKVLIRLLCASTSAPFPRNKQF